MTRSELNALKSLSKSGSAAWLQEAGGKYRVTYQKGFRWIKGATVTAATMDRLLAAGLASKTLSRATDKSGNRAEFIRITCAGRATISNPYPIPQPARPNTQSRLPYVD